MRENTVQIGKRVTTRFRVADPRNPGLVEVEWTIRQATLFHPDYTPPKTLSVIASLEIDEEPDRQPFSIGYLGLSTDQDDPVVSPGSGKVLGPFVVYDLEMPSSDSLYQHQFGDRLSGEVNVRVYPLSDTHLGLWALLSPALGG